MKLEDLRKALRDLKPKPKLKFDVLKPRSKRMERMPLACPRCKSHMINILERDRDILKMTELLKVKCLHCDTIAEMEVDSSKVQMP